MDALIEHSRRGAATLARKSRAKRDADAIARREPSRPHADTPPPEVHTPPQKADARPPARDPRTGDAAIVARRDAAADTPRDITPRNTSAEVVNLSNKPGDRAGTKPAVKPATDKEKAAWERARREHEERVRKRREKQEREEAEKKKREQEEAEQAASAGAQGTTDSAKQDRGTAKENQGTQDNGLSKTPAGSKAKPEAPSGSSGAEKQPPADPRHRRPLDPDDPDVLSKRRVIPPAPDPPAQPMHVKGEELPEGTHKESPTANPRTASTPNTRVLQRDWESDHGAQPLGHDTHHIGPHRGGREVGEQIRDSMGASGVGVNDGANAVPARGMPRDPNAPLESASQHWGLHAEDRWEALRRDLETARGDPDAVEDILRNHGIDIWEGGRPTLPDFWLGPDPPPKPTRPRGGGAKRKK
jgi:hypothetical protein